MIIKEINIQNFKSFGNNKQTIQFDENGGKLILLLGDNGAGKSSFQETIDYSLFGIVRGKEKKRIPQTELPNRINGSLLTSIKFINNNDNIFIERGLKPIKLKILKNNNDITSEYRNYNQDKKDNIIGMNYDIYKSFISMNLNDFTNFINLDPDTKRKLLNKLFNLNEIDSYYNITKDILRNNNNNINQIKLTINKNIETINTYNKNLIKIKELIGDDKHDIKKELLSYKSKFIELKNSIIEINQLLKNINNDIKNRQIVLNGKTLEINKLEINIKHNIKKIKVFNSGKCPICNTILTDNKHKDILNNLINNNNQLKENKDELYNEIDLYKINNKLIYNNKFKLIKDKNELIKEYRNIEIKLKELKKDYINYNKNKEILNEIKNNINKLENDNNELNNTLNNLNIKNMKYEKLNEIFSNNGIRKNIIKDLIIPLNKYLSYYLKELNSDFNINIDEKFNANIYERHINKIHPETLSSGESKKINIALALSYLEIIRKKNKSNILFLDELFANIDSENIDLLLKTLKTFSIKYNINIIIIVQDYYPLNEQLFDRIIKIEKNIFSIINEN